MFAAMRRASSLESSLVAARRPGSSSKLAEQLRSGSSARLILEIDMRRLRMQHDVIRPIAGAFSHEILVTILDGLECCSAVAPIGEIDECSCTAVKREVVSVV